VNNQTDHVIKHRRSDIVVVDKENSRTLVIDIAVPGDTGVNENEQEKVDKYQDLARDFIGSEDTVIPIVIGALGTMPRGLEENVRTLGITMKLELIQKVALIATT